MKGFIYTCDLNSPVSKAEAFSVSNFAIWERAVSSFSPSQSYKTFYGRQNKTLIDFRNKLECLSLASLSSLI
jgi:hypothetical protein